MKLIKTTIVLLLALFVLNNHALAGDATLPVIGKAKIKAGAIVMVTMLDSSRPDGILKIFTTAYKDQEFYIYHAFKKDGLVIGYITEGEGFIGLDSANKGRVFKNSGVPIMLLIPQVVVDDGKVEITLFNNI